MTQSLVSKLLEASAQIHKSSSVIGNFVVVSPYYSSILSETIRKELRKEKIRLIFSDTE